MPCPCSCCKGACCNGGACTQETCHDCEQAGGVYQGAGVACDGVDCPCDPPADHSLCEKCLEGVVVDKCEEGQYCCDGLCQDEPCADGACCIYEETFSGWSFVSCSDTTSSGCTAGTGQYASFKAGVSCADTPSPCGGDPSGTCCDGSGGCLTGGPGAGCVPTGATGDDGCYCDSACYTTCFDCCGADAPDCCTPKPEIQSLWDDSAGPGVQMIDIVALGGCLQDYAVDLNEAWHAAMQSGAVFDGKYHTNGFSRISLILCLQDMEAGAVPWMAQQNHRDRVVQTATEARMAEK